MTNPAPWWVRALAWSVRRLPRGRYAVISKLRSRTPPFVAALAPEVGGARFECDLGDDIAREACLAGCYEPPVTRLFIAHLRPGGVVVDAGANWGYFALVAASAVGPAGRVLALEPHPDVYRQLARNAALNGFTQLEPIEAAASSANGRARLVGFDRHARNRGVSTVEHDRSASGADVRCTTIDALTAGMAVDLVKIDIEGGEADALEGMRDGLAVGRYRAILLELHPSLLAARGTSVDRCTRILSDAGYAGSTLDVAAATYRNALSPRIPVSTLLAPESDWTRSPWPHQLWLAPRAAVA